MDLLSPLAGAQPVWWVLSLLGVVAALAVDRAWGPPSPRLRALVRPLVLRLVALGPTARLVAVTAAAAGVGWRVAVVIGLDAPVFCAVAATLAVQISAHSSIRVGAQRLAATVLGLSIAYGIYQLLGMRIVAVVLIVATSLAVGRLVGLGADGAVGVAATSLFMFVMREGLTNDLIVDRAVSTAMGVAIGAVFSLAAHRLTAAERARAVLAELAASIGDVLRALGDGSARPYTQDEAASWLADSRKLAVLLRGAEEAVDEAVAEARWSRRASDGDAAALVANLRVLDHSSDQANDIARSLFDAAVVQDEAAPLPGRLADVLAHTASAFASHADSLVDGGETTHFGRTLEEVRQLRRQSVATLRHADDTGIWLLAGAVLADVDRMVGALDRSAPALQVGLDDAVPAPPLAALRRRRERSPN